MFHAPSTAYATRRIGPSHREWIPHDYQERAVRFLCGLDVLGRPAASGLTDGMARALFLDPGLGKTSIVLEAFRRLKLVQGDVTMLVVAPLRVCQLVWPAEGGKWSQFRDLKIVFLHGDKKDRLLKEGADIFLINPEGVPWLSERFFGRSLPFDIVCIDELTKFKNARATRHKKLLPRLRGVRRRWGLTGTPAPNGYMDLFGQFLLLDDGAALGKYITHFRDQYFVLSFNGFDYNLQAGAGQKIETRIQPYVLRMSAEDYLDLPPLIEDRRLIDMDPKSRKLYDELAKETIVGLEGRVITGANAGAVYSKLKQMANGAVYVGEGDKREVLRIHDAKLDALEDLVDELAGQPLLVAYEFNHDLERLLERFPGTPYLGRGIGAAETKKAESDWNAGKLRLMFVHPQSAGHGLNLQEGHACHICWFSPIWDLELWDQLIRRLLRQGNEAAHVINHILIVRGTLDEEALTAIEEKDTTQSRLLDRLNFILYSAETTESDMGFKKLGQNTTAAATATTEAAAEPRRGAPAGWGKPTGGGDEATQRERVAEKISAAAPVEEAQDAPPATTKPRGKAAATNPAPEQEDVPVREVAKSAFSKVLDTEPGEGDAPAEGEQVQEQPATKAAGWGKPGAPAAAEQPKTTGKAATAAAAKKAAKDAPAAEQPAVAQDKVDVDMVGRNGSAKFEMDENGIAHLELRLNLRLPLADLGAILSALGKVLPGVPF